jgi:hypothetical protein
MRLLAAAASTTVKYQPFSLETTKKKQKEINIIYT